MEMKDGEVQPKRWGSSIIENLYQHHDIYIGKRERKNIYLNIPHEIIRIFFSANGEKLNGEKKNSISRKFLPSKCY